jgi:hypothetical protein
VSKLKKNAVDSSRHEWVAVKDAFDRIMTFARERNLAGNYLNEDLRSGQLGSKKVQISPDGKRTETLLNPSDWEQWRVLVPSLRVHGWDPNENAHLFVRRVDLDELYPIPATPSMTAATQSDDNRPPERRRGPVTTHDWHSIDGEIARRCINPKTGRVSVPKKENALVAEMRTWCKDQGWAAPATSEMSEAVRRVCAALRTVQK